MLVRETHETFFESFLSEKDKNIVVFFPPCSVCAAFQSNLRTNKTFRCIICSYLDGSFQARVVVGEAVCLFPDTLCSSDSVIKLLILFWVAEKNNLIVIVFFLKDIHFTARTEQMKYIVKF